MKRVIVLVLAMLLVSATVATVAYAVDKVCQPQKRCVGTNSSDILSGSKGNDTIIALGGHDSLGGDTGNDVIRAGPGNDDTLGGPGRDAIYGGAGTDNIWAEAGSDRLWGGKGGDTLDLGWRDRVKDFANCGPGIDWYTAVEAHDVVRNCENEF